MCGRRLRERSALVEVIREVWQSFRVIDEGVMEAPEHAAEILIRNVRVSRRFDVAPKCHGHYVFQVRSWRHIAGGWCNRCSTIGKVAADSHLPAEGLMSIWSNSRGPYFCNETGRFQKNNRVLESFRTRAPST